MTQLIASYELAIGCESTASHPLMLLPTSVGFFLPTSVGFFLPGGLHARVYQELYPTEIF